MPRNLVYATIRCGNFSKTNSTKAYNGIADVRSPVKFFKGHVDLSVPQMRRIFLQVEGAWAIVTGILLPSSDQQAVGHHFRSFQNLWFWRRAPLTRVHYHVMWDHFKTTCGKSYLPIFTGHVYLSVPQMPGISPTG